jgi:hypothetical protein
MNKLFLVLGAVLCFVGCDETKAVESTVVDAVAVVDSGVGQDVELNVCDDSPAYLATLKVGVGPVAVVKDAGVGPVAIKDSGVGPTADVKVKE